MNVFVISRNGHRNGKADVIAAIQRDKPPHLSGAYSPVSDPILRASNDLDNPGLAAVADFKSDWKIPGTALRRPFRIYCDLERFDIDRLIFACRESRV